MKHFLIVLFIAIACTANAQSNGDLKLQKLIIKHLSKPLTLLKSSSQIDFSAATFEIKKFEKLSDISQFVAKGLIVYNSSCGKQTSETEIHFEASQAEKLSRKSKLIYVEVLQPRCEG